MVKYLIIGGGYISDYLVSNLPLLQEDTVTCAKNRIYEFDDVRSVIRSHKPDIVINCIGKTGTPNVDWCENNKYVTHKSNTIIPWMIARVCQIDKIKFINIGTGCIYNGGIFKETDEPNFQGSFYSRTKRMAEDLVDEFGGTTLRIRLPISEDNNPKNFLTKVINYKRVTHIPNSVTFLKDLANAIPWIVNKKLTGRINVVHPQVTTAYHITFHCLNLDKEKVAQEDLGIGKRANCVLRTNTLEDSGFTFVDFHEELQRCYEGIQQ